MTEIYYISAVMGVIYGYFSIKRNNDYVEDSLSNIFNSLWTRIITIGGIVFSAYKINGLFSAFLCICIFYVCQIIGRMICASLGHAKDHN